MKLDWALTASGGAYCAWELNGHRYKVEMTARPTQHGFIDCYWSAYGQSGLEQSREACEDHIIPILIARRITQ